MKRTEMTEEAREARRAYQRAWYQKNKDKAAESQIRYWQKKAAQKEMEEQKEN